MPVTGDDKIGDRHSCAYRPLIIEAPRERSNAKLSPFPPSEREEEGEVVCGPTETDDNPRLYRLYRDRNNFGGRKKKVRDGSPLEWTRRASGGRSKAFRSLARRMAAFI